ncbi:gamma-glutamyltransferase family protein [Parenemella sanctibonifatiensis]|uniref:Gamma-glutamyltransferase n=1 Tax=Parenemella sanctibonifatiensis TaxID=2016505 RepID=A0A255ER44_9ACTN|nr:gamma-glutamyltransferase [Parenemella sanctibonifatiensis]OYN90593.1 gamma-glutamyltransferase [Parenemella sanctibonifatiensis]
MSQHNPLPRVRTSRRTVLAAAAGLGLAAGIPLSGRAYGQDGPVPEPLKVPEAVGAGGSISSVDPYASDIGLQVLKSGGNAVDAVLAAAAALGVTEPFSSGIGGGGFFVFHHARSGHTWTINGRENAPRSFTETSLTDESGAALDFDTVVTSGLSVGVPGTLSTWALAAKRFGSRKLAELLEPAIDLARRGFVVDQNYHDHIASNADRFAKFQASADLFLPGGEVPEVGSTFRNPDLAQTYQRLQRRGEQEFHFGSIAKAIIAEAQRPTTVEGVSVLPGQMTATDLRRYRAVVQDATHSRYEGHDVYGMDVPSSGGIAVGQILNLIEAYAERTGQALAELDEVDYLHRFSEASATAFADRNRWVGDVDGVPVEELLSEGFARERAGLFDPDRAQPRPIPFGFPDGDYDDEPGEGGRQDEPYEGPHTTHLNAADRWGNVVSYTLTIEQTGGSAITVPGHGFLLNNELTDFNFVPLTEGVPDPNLPGPGKQPRSSTSARQRRPAGTRRS